LIHAVLNLKDPLVHALRRISSDYAQDPLRNN
jgi:hypothetical protein